MKKLKSTLGIILICMGLIYEVDVYIELKFGINTDLTNKTSNSYSGVRVRLNQTIDQIPVNNFQHILYGIGMLSGAILLASVKDKNYNLIQEFH